MNYTISEKDLLNAIKAAAAAGYNPMIYINGEYYNIKLETETKTEEKK